MPVYLSDTEGTMTLDQKLEDIANTAVFDIMKSYNTVKDGRKIILQAMKLGISINKREVSRAKKQAEEKENGSSKG